MKIYTKTGDKGSTSLFSGERISKTDSRVEAYGSVDELNSLIGVLTSWVPDQELELVSEIQQIQSNLFVSGSWLATTEGSANIERLEKLEQNAIVRLEQAIDRMTEKLPELKGFILPGGGKPAAYAHLARSVCRRAERNVLRLEIDDPSCMSYDQLIRIKKYLNRLSDYFFTLARYLNLVETISDKLWKSK